MVVLVHSHILCEVVTGVFMLIARSLKSESVGVKTF